MAGAAEFVVVAVDFGRGRELESANGFVGNVGRGESKPGNEIFG